MQRLKYWRYALTLLALAGLAGCQSLPVAAQAMAQPALTAPASGTAAVASAASSSAASSAAASAAAPHPVRLQGARGPLSATQSQQVLQRLRSAGQDTDIFDRHLAVEEVLADGPLTTGNAVRLLQDGPDTYAAMLKAIAQARDHINMETYILDDDEVGQKFARALLEKARQGVHVNLIHDSVGTFSTPVEFFDRLRQGGVQVLEFNPANPVEAWLSGKGWSPNQRDHRKLLIVDGHTAFLGGINISSVYSGGSRRGLRAPAAAPGATANAAANATAPSWRDTHLQVQGPVVAELQKLFLASWLQQTGAAPLPRDYFPTAQAVGRQVVRVIANTPSKSDASPIYATLMSAIGSAETTVYITNAYFAPGAPMLAAHVDAAARGVDVQLILPGHTDSWLIFHAGRATYDELLQAGVKIHERRDVLLHSKTAVIDGVWSTVGSTNLDWRSFLHNQEVNAVVLGTDFGDQLRQMFDSDRRASDPVLLPDWRARPWLSRLKEFFAQLWGYWL